jgi:type IV secretory pathway VirB2 component (pilin)
MKKNYKILLLLLLVLVPYYGFATTATNFQEVGNLACAIAKTVSGNIAKAIATIGIVFLGARAFVGKLDWPTVLIVALGIFIVFGFEPLIKTIGTVTGIGALTVCP